MFSVFHPNACVKYRVTVQDLMFSLLNPKDERTMILWWAGIAQSV